jgi:hypothetical protein
MKRGALPSCGLSAQLKNVRNAAAVCAFGCTAFTIAYS